MPALRAFTLATYAGLIALIVAWEAWLAPGTRAPRLFWLTAKLLPLAIPLYGVLRANAKMHVVAALVALLYIVEGVMLAFSAAKGTEAGGVGIYAVAQTLLAAGFFVAAAYYVRFKGLEARNPARE